MPHAAQPGHRQQHLVLAPAPGLRGVDVNGSDGHTGGYRLCIGVVPFWIAASFANFKKT